MALRSCYKGFKKLLPGLKLFRPGTLGIDNDVLIPALNKIFFPRSEQAVLGAKNLLPNNGVNTTHRGVGFTVADDKSVIANGTNDGTDNSSISINSGYLLKAGTYTLSGGINADKYILLYKSVSPYTTIANTGSAGTVEFTLDNDETVAVSCVVASGKTANNDVFYPMLRLATDPDDTYAPYAMTNRELTYKKQGSALIETYTFAENISSDAAAVARAGYIIMHTLRLIVSANIEANTVVITDGLGYAAVNIDLSFNTVFRTSAGDEYKMSIVTVSGGKVQLKTLTAIPNGTHLRGSIIFISQ